MLYGLGVLILGVIAWLLQVVLAYQDNFLTPEQMMSHHGTGLPLQYHMGITWGDLLFVTPLCAFLVARYHKQWKWGQVLTIGGIALVLGAVMHYQYLQDPIPSAHMHDGTLTIPAYVHFAYMWGALTVIGLFYVYTHTVSTLFVMLVTIGLWVHLVLGTHILIKLWSPPWFPPQPVADTVTLVVWGASAIILATFAALMLHRNKGRNSDG